MVVPTLLVTASGTTLVQHLLRDFRAEIADESYQLGSALHRTGCRELYP